MTRDKLIDRLLETYALMFVFIIMVITFSILVPTFFTWDCFVNIIVAAAPMGIATIGMAIVILQGGIDLSAGSTMYLGAIACSTVIGKDYNISIFILLALAVGSLIGLVNGFLITRFRVLPFIATYGTMMLARGIALTLSGQKNIIFADPVASYLCSEKILGLPIVVLIFFLIILMTYILLNQTPFGRHLYAIGNNQRSAEKIGLKVKRVRIGAYVICASLASLSGLLFGAQAGAFNPSLGTGKEFVFISAAVLGGVSLTGGRCRVFPHLFMGIIIITAIESGLVMVSANPYLYQIIRGGLIAFAVIVDSIRYKGDLR